MACLNHEQRLGFALGSTLKVLEIIFAAIAEVISGLVTPAASGSGTGNTDYFQIALHKMPDRPAFYFKHGPFYNLYFHPPPPSTKWKLSL